MGRVEVAAAAAAVAGAALLVRRSPEKQSTSPAKECVAAIAEAPQAARPQPVKRSVLGTLFCLSALVVGVLACVAAYAPIPGVSVSDFIGESSRIYLLSLGLATVAASLSFLIEEGARSHRARRAASQQQLAVSAVSEEPAGEALATPEEMRILGAQISGEWCKDKKNSSSMRPALDIIQAGFLLPVKLIGRMEVKLDQSQFRFAVYSAIGSWFKVMETYPVTGEEAVFRRRDLRAGDATGRCAVYRDRVQLVMSWQDEFPGSEVMVFTPREHGLVLHVDCCVTLQTGATATYNHVYIRRSPLP